jgi:molybdopterin-guanine dinucleotide biosynthesis protein A
LTELFGLVVIGGKSSRMGEDKSLLNYHGLPQRYYLYEMLQPVCKKVFLSCNHEQAAAIPANYNVITDSDTYNNTGPMAALLSAFENHAEVSFLSVGCDYPFITKDDLLKLIEARSENVMAVSYFNQEFAVEEPLLAIYENTSYPEMMDNYKNEKYSLRHFLKEINAVRIMPSHSETIMSIDTQKQFEDAKHKINITNQNNLYL